MIGVLRAKNLFAAYELIAAAQSYFMIALSAASQSFGLPTS